MPSSSNTFGTFLQTFNSLENKNSALTDINNEKAKKKSDLSKNIIDIVQNIAQNGDEKNVRDLVKLKGLRPEEILSAMIEGKNHGLIEVRDEDGESIANLTSLGKAFIS